MRKVFTLITVTLLFTGLLSIGTTANNDIDKIKKRVLAEILKPEVDDSEIEKLVETLKDDGTWPGIDYENVSREGFEHRYHHANMVTLARAYKTKSSKYHKKKKVKETIGLALQNWVEHDYFCNNWWHNQIFTPQSLATILLIMKENI